MANVAVGPLEGIHAAFITAIKGITPTYQYAQQWKWRNVVENEGEVAGADPRTFRLDWTVPERFENGWFCDGVERFCQLDVVVSYSGLKQTIQPLMAAGDAEQLLVTLEALNSGPNQVTGLILVEELGPFEAEPESEPGHAWGRFSFRVRYYAEG